MLIMSSESMPHAEQPAGTPQKIVMYSTPWCGYCTRAKRLLTSKGFAFTEIDVDGDSEKRAWLRQVTGRRTVPQIFIGTESVGGYDEIAALDRMGQLDRMVKGK